FVFSPTRRSLLSTLFPYTTLFRSISALKRFTNRLGRSTNCAHWWWMIMLLRATLLPAPRTVFAFIPIPAPAPLMRRYRYEGEYRSEEHTSELQSRENLVCRLLLEK